VKHPDGLQPEVPEHGPDPLPEVPFGLELSPYSLKQQAAPLEELACRRPRIAVGGPPSGRWGEALGLVHRGEGAAPIQLAAVSKLHDKDLAAAMLEYFPSTPWKGNIQPLPGISSGSGFSRRKNSLQYREHQKIGAITCTKPGFKRR
jgi:hypothetical protein